MKPLNMVGFPRGMFLAAIIVVIAGSLAVSARASNLYVTYFYTNTVNVFDPSGTDLGTFCDTGGVNPRGLAFDGNGNLYVSNLGLGFPDQSNIHKFGPDGTDMGTFASWHFNTLPSGLAIDAQNNVYVALNNEEQIHKFSPTGTDLGTFVNLVNYDPNDLAFDRSGNLYATTNLNGIHKYSPTGALLGVLSGSWIGLAIDSHGNIFASNGSNNTISEFGPTGANLGVFAHTSSGPYGLAFDSSGNLYVTTNQDSSNQIGTIQKFSPTGANLGIFATTGRGTGPQFLAFAPVPPGWTGTSTAVWADIANWSGPVPGATAGTSNTDTALFNQNAPNSPLTIDAGRNVQNITFDTASVNSLPIGTVSGQALLLTAGGTIQTTSTVVNPQTVNAPLVLEGDYTFSSGATISSATLSFGGGITPAATSGVTTLTLNGSNTGANTINGVLVDNGSGQLAVTVSGSGSWFLSGANTYSGGTAVSGGSLTTTVTGGIGSGPLIVSAADTITSTLNLGASQTVNSLSGTLAGSGSAIVNIAGGTTLTVSQSGNTSFAGTLVNSGTVAKTDVGTLEFDGAPTLNNNSSLQAIGGTMRFNVNSGTATVGTGVKATVASGATLELAGSVSALSSGSNRATIINISQQASGGMLLVSGSNQQVGAIDGTGDTVVNAGSDLTADHIIQNALIVGGASGNLGQVIIAGSDASGNPMEDAIALALAGSLAPHGPFGDGTSLSSSLDGLSGSNAGTAGDSADGSNANAARSAVPEPSTATLLALAGLLSCSLLWRSRLLWHRRLSWHGRETSPQRRFDERNDSCQKQLIRHDR